MFGIGDIAGAVIGGGLGLLGGKKGSQQTQQVRPYLPEGFEKGYNDTLLPDAMALYRQPFPARDMMRYDEAASPFERQFQSKQAIMMQKNKDVRDALARTNPAPQSNFTQPDQTVLKDEILGRILATQLMQNVAPRYQSMYGPESIKDADQFKLLNEIFPNGGNPRMLPARQLTDAESLILNRYRRG